MSGDRKVLWVRNYKAGFFLQRELVDGKEYGVDDFEITSAYNPSGDYIGSSKDAWSLCVKRGIAPFLRTPTSQTCSIGFCARDGKWYGWSHRAIHGFAVGHAVRKGSCCAVSGWTDEYLAEHPEEDISLPVGFTAHDLTDAKMMAEAFAESVS